MAFTYVFVGGMLSSGDAPMSTLVYQYTNTGGATGGLIDIQNDANGPVAQAAGVTNILSAIPVASSTQPATAQQVVVAESSSLHYDGITLTTVANEVGLITVFAFGPC